MNFRKLISYALVFVLVLNVLFLSSCGKDDGGSPQSNAPSLNVTAKIGETSIQTGDEVEVGSTISFIVSISAPAGISELDMNGITYSPSDLGIDPGETEAEFTITSDINETMAGFEVSFTFQAMDDDGRLSDVVSFKFAIPEIQKPSVTVSATVGGSIFDSGDDAEVGSIVSFAVDVSAPGGIFSLDVNETTYSRSELGASEGDTEGQVTFDRQLEESDLGELELIFQATDDAGGVSESVTFTINVTSPPARLYEDVTLQVISVDFLNSSFFSTEDGTARSPTDVVDQELSSMMDFGYYYGGEDFASIASPAWFSVSIFSTQVDGWDANNATILRPTSLNAADFSSKRTFADIDEAFEVATSEDERVIKNLSLGDVFTFKTVDGVRGLAHVSDINPTFESDGYIVLDILAQLEPLD